MNCNANANFSVPNKPSLSNEYSIVKLYRVTFQVLKYVWSIDHEISKRQHFLEKFRQHLKISWSVDQKYYYL